MILDTRTFARRLDGWIALLEPIHTSGGRVWYLDAHTFCKTLADDTGIDLTRVCAVLSVLSPQNMWDTNKRDCQNICQAHASGIDLASVTVATYPAQKAKVIRILQADTIPCMEEAIGGNRALKTRSFYCNVLYAGSDRAVTIDRHMLAAFGLKDVKIYQLLYVTLADVIRQRADTLDNVTPPQLQAMIWLCCRAMAELPF